MQFRRSANDPLLKRFLSAKDASESARQLAILLADHAEARIKKIIMARLHSYFNSYEHHPDFEDLYSEVKTRLVIYLEELKTALTARPCKDFRSYVAAIAYNVCNDYLRQMYPARARLYKQVRDLLHAHPDFAIWRAKDENNRNDWSCGFSSWQAVGSASESTAWLQRFYKKPRAVIEILAQGTDIQIAELDLDYANLHLTNCGWCREEITHFSEFTSKLEHYLSKRHAPIKQTHVRNKYFQKFGAFPFAWSTARLAGITALTLTLISAILFWSMLGTEPRVKEASLPVRSQEEASSLAQATDTSQPVQAPLQNRNGGVEKPNSRVSSIHIPSNREKDGNVEREFEASLIAENLIMPSVIEVFDRSSVVLRGNDNKGESFNIISPYSTVISDNRPIFRWIALSGASRYVVSIYDEKLNLIKTSEPVVENQWVMPGRLERGVIYTWVVTAIKDGKEVIAPTLPARAEFKVIEKPERAKLSSKINQIHSGAARAVLYAKAGLLDDAEQELRTLLSQRPDDGQAKCLLQTIKSWREP